MALKTHLREVVEANRISNHGDIVKASWSSWKFQNSSTKLHRTSMQKQGPACNHMCVCRHTKPDTPDHAGVLAAEVGILASWRCNLIMIPNQWHLNNPLALFFGCRTLLFCCRLPTATYLECLAGKEGQTSPSQNNFSGQEQYKGLAQVFAQEGVRHCGLTHSGPNCAIPTMVWRRLPSPKLHGFTAFLPGMSSCPALLPVCNSTMGPYLLNSQLVLGQ